VDLVGVNAQAESRGPCGLKNARLWATEKTLLLAEDGRSEAGDALSCRGGGSLDHEDPRSLGIFCIPWETAWPP
jgi:hypothetical protein